jgi:EAL domain-containing protein (putative c-di-GMP-specific phosphodiesterase class I)
MAVENQPLVAEAWFLDQISGPGTVREYRISILPWTIGRASECNLTLRSNSVSKEHVRIERGVEGLRIVDLGSTNGTHLNGQPVSGALALRSGDILNVGEFQFSLRAEPTAEDAVLDGEESLATRATMLVSDPLVAETRSFLGLLNGRGIAPHYQPVISLTDHVIQGFEVLARVDMASLPNDASKLFLIAKRFDAQRKLSRLLWVQGIRLAAKLPKRTLLFVNIHPSELVDPHLVRTLEKAQAEVTNLRIVVEIHENSVVNLGWMGRFKDDLGAAGIGLAYDDFGAGEARLNELAEVPPDYLKFDRRLIVNLDRGGLSKRHVVESLVHMVRDLGVIPLAEGIETAGQAEACAEIGFDLAQGFFFGVPRPIGHWLSPDRPGQKEDDNIDGEVL